MGYLLTLDSQEIKIVNQDSKNVKAVVRLDVCHAKKVP